MHKESNLSVEETQSKNLHGWIRGFKTSHTAVGIIFIILVSCLKFSYVMHIAIMSLFQFLHIVNRISASTIHLYAINIGYLVWNYMKHLDTLFNCLASALHTKNSIDIHRNFNQFTIFAHIISFELITFDKEITFSLESVGSIISIIEH